MMGWRIGYVAYPEGEPEDDADAGAGAAASSSAAAASGNDHVASERAGTQQPGPSGSPPLQLDSSLVGGGAQRPCRMGMANLKASWAWLGAA
jgi:hypothetical protein